LIKHGAHQLWRRFTTELSRRDRQCLGRWVQTLSREHRLVGDRDPGLKQALRLPIAFFAEGLRIIDGFDAARRHYHRASLVQRKPGASGIFRRELALFRESLRGVMEGVNEVRAQLASMEKAGHTPYDARVLARHRKDLAALVRLVDGAVKKGLGLPYFETLLWLPKRYFESNLDRFEIQNTYFDPFEGVKWLVPGEGGTARSRRHRRG
jgi:hypothetical protein